MGMDRLVNAGPLSLDRPPLTEDVTVDVCVIGAGVAGLLTAYQLIDDGHRVLVLDDGPIGGGETSRTTAHLSNAWDDRYQELERIYGLDACRLCADSHTTAIDLIERVIEREQIQCHFGRVDGYLFLPPGETPSLLENEYAVARKAGLDVSLVSDARLGRRALSQCLKFPRQGQLLGLEFLDGLARAIERRGNRIHCGVRVTEVVAGPVVHTASRVTIRAQSVVCATNSPLTDHVRLSLRQAPYRTYALAIRVPPGSVEPGLYWDTSQEAGNPHAPYHYVRFLHPPGAQGGGEPATLIVGGEDHKTGHGDEGEQCWTRLELWARDLFDFDDVVHRWSGQVYEPSDGLAFIGRSPSVEHTYLVTGDSGMGFTHAGIAALLISDLVAGRHNPWESLYNPRRAPLKTLLRATSENLDVLAQYTDWLTPGDERSVSAIPAGAGAIIRRGLTLHAVHRDPQGVLHERSAVCPHMGCVVRWNAAEMSWDCPCHGSRFTADGELLNGPAVCNLSGAR